MKELTEDGCYQVDDETFRAIADGFAAGFCDDEATLRTIRQVFDSSGYLCDTHTAVAVRVYEDYVERTGDKTPAVVVSTASPYKFAPSVLAAVDDDFDKEQDAFAMVERLSELTHTEVPQPIADLENKEVRFQNVCTKEAMGEVLLQLLDLT